MRLQQSASLAIWGSSLGFVRILTFTLRFFVPFDEFCTFPFKSGWIQKEMHCQGSRAKSLVSSFGGSLQVGCTNKDLPSPEHFPGAGWGGGVLRVIQI